MKSKIKDAQPLQSLYNQHLSKIAMMLCYGIARGKGFWIARKEYDSFQGGEEWK